MSLKVLSSFPPLPDPAAAAFTDTSSFLYAPALLQSDDVLLRHVPDCFLNYAKSDPEKDVLSTPSHPACTCLTSLCAHPTSGKVRSYARAMLPRILEGVDRVPTVLEPVTVFDNLAGALKGLAMNKVRYIESQSDKRIKRILVISTSGSGTSVCEVFAANVELNSNCANIISYLTRYTYHRSSRVGRQGRKKSAEQRGSTRATTAPRGLRSTRSTSETSRPPPLNSLRL